MARDQLALLIKLEAKKEDKLRLDFIKAKQHLVNLEQQLAGIDSFRTDYLTQLQHKAAAGVGGGYYIQFQQFIGKLDSAQQQQVNAIQTAKKVLQQRESLWLTQKAKLEAIQKLSQKKTQQAHTLQMKAEQKQLDEFSTNLYLRSR